jgi:hypothetical protein
MTQVPAFAQSAVPPVPRPPLWRRAIRYLLPALVIATAVGVWQRERLWIWYCAERLERASTDDQRAAWADKLANTGEAALPTLIALLLHDDPDICTASKDAIAHLAAGWSADDPRRAAFARRFVDTEPRFSTPGRAAALDLLPIVMVTDTPDIVDKAKGMLAGAGGPAGGGAGVESAPRCQAAGRQ